MDYVTIFSDENFTGASQQLTEGSYDVNDLAIGEDQLSSLTVPYGFKVTLFADAGFAGGTQIITEDVNSLYAYCFNDMTSAIKVERAITIYGESNFSGICEALTPGNYDTNYLNTLFNGYGTVDSLKVPAGFKVTLFSKEGFSGNSKEFTADADYVGDDFINATCSLKVEIVAAPAPPMPKRVGPANKNVILFDGTSAYGSTQLNVSEKDYTMSIWFKTSNKNCGIFSVDEGDKGVQGHDRHLFLKNGNICARIWQNETIKSSGKNFADGKWHKAIHVFGGSIGGQRIYVDGVLEAKGNKATSDFKEQDGINVGYSNDAVNPYFDGEISEVAIWKIARNKKDITNMSEMLLGNEKGLLVYWSFKDVKSTSVTKNKNGSTVTKTSYTITDRTNNKIILSFQGKVKWQVSNNYSGVYLPVISSDTIAAINSQGAMLATAVQPISEGYKNIPPDTQSPVALPVLVQTGLPQSDVCTALTTAVSNNQLTLTQNLLGTYGAAAAGISDIISAFVSITNPVIKLVKITPGESGNAGDTIDGNVLATLQSTALQIAGSATVVEKTVQLKYAEFSQIDKSPYAVLKFMFNEPIGIGMFSKDVPVLSSLTVSDAALVISSTDDIKEAVFDKGLHEGFNFFGSFLLGDSNTPGTNPFQFIGSLFGIPQINLHGVISTSVDNPLYLIEADIPFEKYIIDGENFKLKFSNASIGFEVKGEPLDPSMTVSNETVITLNASGNKTDLVFTGGIIVDPESITASFTMDAENGKPYSSPDGTVVSKGEWVNPFGIPGVTIRELAVQVGFTYDPPFIDNIGVHGNLKLGTVDGTISVLVDITQPDQFILAGATDHITLFEIMSCMTPVTFAAYQAASSAGITQILDKFVNISLDDVNINIVPVAASIGAIDFEQGITVKGKLEAWGWNASMDLNVDTGSGADDGLYLTAQMDEINIADIFKVTGAGTDPNPLMNLIISPTSMPDVTISGDIYLLGMEQELEIKGNSSGFTFLLERKAADILDARLDCGYGDGNFTADGSLTFHFDTSISTDLGNFTLNLDMDAAAHISVGTAGFNFTTHGNFDFLGLVITIPEISLSIAPSDISGLLNAVIKYITDNAVDLFTNFFGDVKAWATSIGQGFLDFADDIATTAKNIFNTAAEDIVDVYKAAKKGVEDIAQGLSKAYGYLADGTADLLSKAGYYSAQIAGVLNDVYNLVANDVAVILRGIGDIAADVAVALQTAEYFVDDVVNALMNAFDQAANDVAAALCVAGYIADDIAKNFNNVWQLAAADTAAALKWANYAVNEVGDAIKNFYNQAAQGVADALSAAGYFIDQAGDYLKNAFQLNPQDLSTVLAAAGYAEDQMKGFFITLGGEFTDFANDTWSKITATFTDFGNDVADAFK